jgi:hypothetical protein
MPDDDLLSGIIELPSPRRSADPRTKVHSIASRIGLSPDLADDFLKVTGGIESGNQHYDRRGRVKRSPAGALGFSQVLPATAKQYGLDPYNEDQNIEAGLRYFSEGGDDPVARRIGYLSGHHSRAVKSYKATGRIPRGGDPYTGVSFNQYVSASQGGQPAKPAMQVNDDLATGIVSDDGDDLLSGIVNESRSVTSSVTVPQRTSSRFGTPRTAGVRPYRRQSPFAGVRSGAGGETGISLGDTADSPLAAVFNKPQPDLPVNPRKITVRPRSFTFDSASDNQVKAEIRRQVAQEQSQYTMPGRAPNLAGRELDAEVEARFKAHKEGRSVDTQNARLGPSVSGVPASRFQRAREVVEPYAPGLANLDTPMGIHTDVLRGAASLGLANLRREITPEESVIDPEAQAKADLAYGLGSTVPSVLPYIGAGKLAAAFPAATRAGAAARTGATFGGVATAREGVHAAQTGEAPSLSNIAIETAIGTAMGGIAGIDPSLKRQIVAFVTPGVVAGVARGEPLSEIAQSAVTNLLFGLHAGSEQKLTAKRIGEIRNQLGGSRVSEVRGAFNDIQRGEQDARQTESIPTANERSGNPVNATPSEILPARTNESPQRYQHLQFGEIEVLPDQSGARPGKIRVAEVADPTKQHFVRKSDMQGRGKSADPRTENPSIVNDVSEKPQQNVLAPDSLPRTPGTVKTNPAVPPATAAPTVFPSTSVEAAKSVASQPQSSVGLSVGEGEKPSYPENAKDRSVEDSYWKLNDLFMDERTSGREDTPTGQRALSLLETMEVAHTSPSSRRSGISIEFQDKWQKAAETAIRQLESKSPPTSPKGEVEPSVVERPPVGADGYPVSVADRSVHDTYGKLNDLFMRERKGDREDTPAAQEALSLLEAIENTASSLSSRRRGITADFQVAWQRDAEAVIRELEKPGQSAVLPIESQQLDRPAIAGKETPELINAVPNGTQMLLKFTRKEGPVADADLKALFPEYHVTIERKYNALTPEHQGVTLTFWNKEGTRQVKAPADAVQRFGLAKTFYAGQEPEVVARPSALPVESAARSADAKEPWQMSRDEWLRSQVTDQGLRSRKKQVGNLTLKEWKTREHESRVRQAVREGKPVPPEVLADYPDLQENAFGNKPESTSDQKVQKAKGRGLGDRSDYDRLYPPGSTERAAYEAEAKRVLDERMSKKGDSNALVDKTEAKTTKTVSSKGEGGETPPEPSFVTAARERKAKREAEKSAGIKQMRTGADPYELADNIIIRGHELYSQHVKPTFQEWSRKLREEFGPSANEHLRPVWKQLSGNENRGTPVKTASIEAERAEAGLDPIEKQQYRNIGEAFTSGKEAVESKRIDPRLVAAEVSGTPRSLTDEETGALGYDRARLRNDYDAKIAELNKAIDAGDSQGVSASRAQLEEIERLADVNDAALEKGGREQSIAFNARKMLVGKDYSLLGSLQRAKAARGEELPANVRGRIETLTKQLTEAEKTIENYKSAKETGKSAREIKKLISDTERESRRQGRATSRQALDSEFAQLSQQFRAKMSGVQPAAIDPSLIPIIAKMARNRVQAGFNTVDGLVDELHSHLKDVVDDKRSIRDAFSGHGQEPKQRTKDELTAELGRLKREARQLSKAEDRDPVTEAAKKEASKQKAVKTRLTKQISELEGRIASGDYSKTPRPKLEYDQDAERLLAHRDLLKDRIEREIAKQKKPLWEDYLSWWQQGTILSGTRTLAKLGSYALGKNAIIPIEDVLSGGMSHVPGLRGLSDASPRYGGGVRENIAAQGAAFREFVHKAMYEDAWTSLKEGTNALKLKHGDSRYQYSPRLLTFIRGLHMAEKVFASRPEYYRSIEKETQWAVRNGLDPADPKVQSQILARSYMNGLRAQLMQPNIPSKMLSTTNQWLESVGRTGKIGQVQEPGIAVAARGMRAGIRTLFPITRVPFNYVNEALSYNPVGGALKGGGRIGAEAIKTLRSKGFGKGIVELAQQGMRNMPPEAADATKRALVKGSLGVPFALIGWFNYQNIGGYYQPGQRKEGDVPFGGLRIGGIEIPRTLVHNPLFETMHFFATMRRVYEGEKGGSYASAAEQAGKGLIEETPFVDVPRRIGKATEGRSGLRNMAGEIARSAVVPPDLQRIASMSDSSEPTTKTQKALQLTGLKDIKTVKRSPQGFSETFSMGVPGLRQRVPINEKSMKAQRKATLTDQFRDGKIADGDLDELVSRDQITEADKKAIVASGTLPPSQAAFNNIQYPSTALDRFERMSPSQRADVESLMSRKAWSLLHSDSLTSAQKEAFQKRIDALGITPTPPGRQSNSSFKDAFKNRFKG